MIQAQPHNFSEMLMAELEKMLTEYSDNKRQGIITLSDVELQELIAELKTR